MLALYDLKNRFAGQNTAHAKRQYAFTLYNRGLLFTFKKRDLVHFVITGKIKVIQEVIL